jgi:hypothetical protein
MTHDLGERMRALAPVLAPPPDVLDTLRPRARRHRAVRSGTRVLGVVAVAAVAVGVPAYVRPGAALPVSVVAQYAAAGDAPAVRYRGADAPDSLRGIPLWVVAQRTAGDRRLALVSYEQDGHPCLTEFDAGSPAAPGGGFQGSCASGDRMDLRWSYQPFGARFFGPDAVLYGTVPAGVRVVAARVRTGRLVQRYVATVGSPADPAERVFVFDSPGGATRRLVADLTFYDAAGRRVGSRHVDADAVVH